jgi:DUF971 family protein
MAEVTGVEVDRAESVTVSFDDGRQCRFGLQQLRRACPCATCRGWRDRGEPAYPRPGAPEPLAITDAELVGAWGISFSWNDGHSTGIYAWEVLRAWCDELEAEGDAPSDAPEDST